PAHPGCVARAPLPAHPALPRPAGQPRHLLLDRARKGKETGEMSAASDVYLFERRALRERLRWRAVGVARHPKLMVGTAIAGMLGTLAAMLIVGNAGEIGAI